MNSLSGRILASRYRLESPIGEGGMGVVYKALDMTTGEPRAVKVLKESDWLRRIENIVRLKREAVALSRLDTPGIVRMYEAASSDGLHYLVMEHAAGRSLDSILRDVAQLPFARVLPVFHGIAATLAYVHEKGIIHRDIKPGNVILTQTKSSSGASPLPKIGDFGLSRFLDIPYLQGNAGFDGTFCYMSPEQIGLISHPVDPRTDLYSAGILLYQLLTGRLPFQGRDLGELFSQMLTFTPPKPSGLNPEIPEAFDGVALRLIDKDPDQRYQTASGLARDLREIEAGRIPVRLSCDDPAGRLTFHTRHIGRKEQLDALKRAYSEASGGSGSVCLVSGEAGSGKSRLAGELAAWATERNALFLGAVCLNQENQTPYQVFSDILLQYIHQAELLPKALRREYYHKLRSAAGDLSGVLRGLSPLLTEMLGPLPEVVALEPQKEQKRFVSVCAAVLRSLGDAARPAVMILDDFQWTDQGSMEILYDIWLRIASVPLLVVACFREGEISPEHPLARYRALARSNNLPTRELTLEALTESDMEGLLGALLRTPARWNGELAAFVAGKSGGNPLFALEITRQLAEKEVLTWRGGGWRFNRELLEKVNIPDRMADAILCHIGSLDAELADLLSVCSLLGKRFGVDFLLSLPGIGDAERVVGLLETAVERELVEWDRRRSGSLLFLHDRIREAFAGRLSPERTRSVHGLIAAAVEKLPPAPENETLFLLVHHFSLSGDWRRCLPYSLKAAERARSANAVSSAIRFFELSLRLLEENSLRGSAEWSTAAHGLIELYPVTGEVKKAGALAEALLAFAKTPTERARLHRIIGINHTRVSSYDRAERNFSTGLKLLGKRIPRSKLTTALFIATELALYPLIALLWPVRRNVARREVTVREREIASLYENASLLFVVSDYFKFFWVTLRLMNFARRRMGVSRELANAVAWYGMSFLAVSWISRSLTHLNRALAMRSSIGDRAGGADDHNWLGFAHSINAEWDKALRHLTAARETCEAIGDYYRLVHVLNGLQNLHYHHTDAEKRLAVLRQMLSVSEVIGSRYGAAVALSGLGGHYLMTGDFDASGSFLENAIEAATSAGQWLIVCIAQCNMGRLLLERRDLDGALRFVDAAAETERTHSLLRPVVAFRYFAMIEVLCARLTAADAPSSGGKRRRELKVLRKEIGRMNRTTRRWPLWRGDALLARAQFFAAAGPARKAEAGFRAAAVVLGKTGKRYELARCSYHFAEFLLAEGRTGEAAPLLRSALDAFRHIGARPYVERTLRLLGSPPEPAAGAPAADAQRLASLLEVSRSLGSLHELDALLKEILERAVETTGAGGGYLFLTGDTGQCELRVSRHAPPSEAAAPTFSKSVVDQVRDSGRTVLAFNAAHQESFKRFESVSANEMKSILCAPIMRRGRVLGVCYLDNSFASGVFDAGDRELLEAFMALAAVCIENARSFEELRSRNRMLADEGEQIKKRNAELQTIVQFQASHLRSFGDVNLVTQDSAMAELVAKANRFAESQAPVLITGPSGSGKEIFAHLIHFSGRRKDGPFVKVNCSAIPETLFESEFFGYEKGAFTGAAAARKGKFELAHGGTLMLDEIAELPPSQQAKLLRVLEEREITPVGGAAPRPVDVRVVAATNRSLPLLVSEGTFRQDLFFRLGVLTLAVPSLSRRPGDIPVLATYFLASVANAEGGREKRFDDNALVALSKMPFEGNVRQLKNLVYQLYVGVDGEIITAGDVVQCEKDERQQPAADDAGTISDLDSGLPRGFLEKTMPFGDMKELFERRYLNVQLEKHDFSLTLTSKALGLLPSSLSRKLKDLGISVKKAKG